jgi:hypothetical protein
MRPNNNSPDEETREEDESIVGFWSDEGARRFNEALDEGRAYLSAQGREFADSDFDGDDVEGEYSHSNLYDADDETLPQGEMELIFENCYIM